MSEKGEDDVYSADTVIREATREELEAIRDTQKTSEKRRAAEQKDARAEELAVSEKTSEAKEAAAPETKEEIKEEPPAAKASIEKPAAKPAAKSEAKATAHAPERATAHAKPIEQPVTLGELTIAFAAAVALIVVGFYVIGSAF